MTRPRFGFSVTPGPPDGSRPRRPRRRRWDTTASASGTRRPSSGSRGSRSARWRGRPASPARHVGDEPAQPAPGRDGERGRDRGRPRSGARLHRDRRRRDGRLAPGDEDGEARRAGGVRARGSRAAGDRRGGVPRRAVRLPWAAGRRIPIVVSAHGPRALRAAGRVGDGVVVGLGVTPEVVAGSLELVEEARAPAGARRRPRRLVHVLLVRGRGARRGRAGGAPGRRPPSRSTSRWGVERRFVRRSCKGRRRARPGVRPRHARRRPAEQQERYASLADELGVGDYLRRRFVFAGTPAEVEAQVRTAIAAGAATSTAPSTPTSPSTASGSAPGPSSSCRASPMIDLRRRAVGSSSRPDGAAELDVAVEGGTIAFLAEPGTVEADARRSSTRRGRSSSPAASSRTRTSSSRCTAAGRKGEDVWLQTPEGATRAAIFGGTTTVLSFAFMAIHVTEQEFDARLAVEHRREVFTGRSYADFAFHPGAHRDALGRDDRERRRRDRRGHLDDEALHDRPDDRPGGRAASTTARRSR